MARTISVRLPAESLREIDRFARKLHTNRSEAVRRLIERGVREARIDGALDRLRGGAVSIGRAAEDAGIPLYEMRELLRPHRISSGYGPEDVKRDLRDLGARG